MVGNGLPRSDGAMATARIEMARSLGFLFASRLPHSYLFLFPPPNSFPYRKHATEDALASLEFCRKERPKKIPQHSSPAFPTFPCILAPRRNPWHWRRAAISASDTITLKTAPTRDLCVSVGGHRGYSGILLAHGPSKTNSPNCFVSSAHALINLCQRLVGQRHSARRPGWVWG